MKGQKVMRLLGKTENIRSSYEDDVESQTIILQMTKSYYNIEI